jgi:Short C-terminal domain
MKRTTLSLKLLVCGAALAAGSLPADAGWVDSLFGKSAAPADTAKANPGQRVWQIREFTRLQRVPREEGSAPNQQPVQLQAEVLRQQLSQVQAVGGSGRQSLFAADELAELVGPLVEAFAGAGAGEDVLLLSASRRDAGIFGSPTAVVARLFVQGESLQLIVHDTRFDFFDNYKGTHVEPRFTFGSRAATGEAAIQSASASNRRTDWLSIPLQMAQAAAPATAATPGPAPPATVRPAAAAPAPRKALDAAAAEDIERRLETLKRLHDKGLISDDEYQQKRQEILQLL